jgi:hypothetical protein
MYITECNIHLARARILLRSCSAQKTEIDMPSWEDYMIDAELNLTKAARCAVESGDAYGTGQIPPYLDQEFKHLWATFVANAQNQWREAEAAEAEAQWEKQRTLEDAAEAKRLEAEMALWRERHPASETERLLYCPRGHEAFSTKAGYCECGSWER